jgi:hypothetical protein
MSCGQMLNPLFCLKSSQSFLYVRLSVFAPVVSILQSAIFEESNFEIMYKYCNMLRIVKSPMPQFLTQPRSCELKESLSKILFPYLLLGLDKTLYYSILPSKKTHIGIPHGSCTEAEELMRGAHNFTKLNWNRLKLTNALSSFFFRTEKTKNLQERKSGSRRHLTRQTVKQQTTKYDWMVKHVT